MKILYNHKPVGELSVLQEKVIKNDIPSEIFEEDMGRRVKYWIETAIFKYAINSRRKFIHQLTELGQKVVPTDDLELAELYCLKCPGPFGYKDISEDIECQIGKNKFSFTQRYQIINRKMLEPFQTKYSEKEYKAWEINYIKKRLMWILTHKYEKCLERLTYSWIAILKREGHATIPVEADEFCSLVFSNPSYKDRSTRDNEDRVSRGNASKI